jgi:hypothetical protein
MTTVDLPDLTSLANANRPARRDGDTDRVRDELLAVIRSAIDAHPRSLQTEIGPSEIGHPCLRALAHKLAGTPPTGLQSPPWRQAVGTAVHKEFTGWTFDANEPLAEHRWYPDIRVLVGDLGTPDKPRPITGTLDLYDRLTATIVDLKVPGPTAMDTRRRGEESELYRDQVHLYGTGVIHAGAPVDMVAILRLPAAGELRDAIWWAEPHDPTRAARAFNRLRHVATLVDALGSQAAALLEPTEHYCGRCDYYLPNTTDLTRGCPGAGARTATGPPASITQLISKGRQP